MADFGYPLWSWRCCKNCPYVLLDVSVAASRQTEWKLTVTRCFLPSGRALSEESYNVTEYCLREQLLVLPGDGEEPCPSPGKSPAGRGSASHLFRLLLLSNHAGDRGEMLLGADTQ